MVFIRDIFGVRERAIVIEIKKYIRVAALLLISLGISGQSASGGEKASVDGKFTSTLYEKSDLYGVWFINVNEGASTGIILLVLKDDGTAIDYLVIDDGDTSQKIIQKSSWVYDSERNMFEQNISEVSVQIGNEPSVVSHSHEVIRASIALQKLGGEVIGIKLTRGDGEVTGYFKGGANMLEVIRRGR
ncbi:hypothetical protein [Pseudomonas protegens]|uniref:hypothetical protein n=1 Tax=Pseudomonas protegens TaxID=380021 RepID=UPI001E4E99DF|nr:hypothetical protein [Pseudomonas protegens]MCD9571448.1 hypothetical protein [Pseudomonas protegens]